MFLFHPVHFLKFLVKSQPQRSYKKRFLYKKKKKECTFPAISTLLAVEIVPQGGLQKYDPFCVQEHKAIMPACAVILWLSSYSVAVGHITEHVKFKCLLTDQEKKLTGNK